MMKKNNTKQSEEKKSHNWNRFTKTGVLTSKFIVLLFLLCLLATITLNFICAPYSFFLIGIEIALTGIIVFRIIRKSTKKTITEKPPRYFARASKESKLLWVRITEDIYSYKSGTTYLFKSVRAYKYATIILAGLSTIILGLDLGEVEIGGEKIEYDIFSKNTALVIGAIITMYTAIMTYWNIEKYWLINKTITFKLRALRDDIEYLQASGSLGDKIDEKLNEYKEIKETIDKYWEGALSKRESQDD